MKFDFKVVFCQWNNAGIFESHKDIDKIIKFSSLISLSIADIECSFSLINLICIPLKKSLLLENLTNCMLKTYKTISKFCFYIK